MQKIREEKGDEGGVKNREKKKTGVGCGRAATGPLGVGGRSRNKGPLTRRGSQIEQKGKKEGKGDRGV